MKEEEVFSKKEEKNKAQEQQRRISRAIFYNISKNVESATLSEKIKNFNSDIRGKSFSYNRVTPQMKENLMKLNQNNGLMPELFQSKIKDSFYKNKNDAKMNKFSQKFLTPNISPSCSLEKHIYSKSNSKIQINSSNYFG